MLDGRRLYEDITFEDSFGQRFYVLVDGSYVMVENSKSTLYGEAYFLGDGVMKQICQAGEQIEL